MNAPGLAGVVFDLDGVLIDSEGAWDAARRSVAAQYGGTWRPETTEALQGMSSLEWGRYLHDVVGVDLEVPRIVELVVEHLLGHYEEDLPLLPGAVEAVRRLAARWPLGLASSSNRVVIDRVLELSGLQPHFAVAVSSEETARGKPAPDVYLEVMRRMQIPAGRSVAVEDSANGVRSDSAAGLRVVVVPRPAFRPPEDVLAGAWLVLDSLRELTADRLVELDQRDRQHLDRRLDEEERESFPASDPHSEWAGPPE